MQLIRFTPSCRALRPVQRTPSTSPPYPFEGFLIGEVLGGGVFAEVLGNLHGAEVG
jgi:hypothetical protein